MKTSLKPNFHKTLTIFKTAPEHFNSPCGREADITINEIETRTLLGTRELRITVDEIIFRKLWEITKEDSKDWVSLIPSVLAFFEQLNYSNETVWLISEKLKKEILFLTLNKKRVIHIPF